MAKASGRDTERWKEKEEGTDDRVGAYRRTRRGRTEVRIENRDRAGAELSAG